MNNQFRLPMVSNNNTLVSIQTIIDVNIMISSDEKISQINQMSQKNTIFNEENKELLGQNSQQFLFFHHPQQDSHQKREQSRQREINFSNQEDKISFSNQQFSNADHFLDSILRKQKQINDEQFVEGKRYLEREISGDSSSIFMKEFEQSKKFKDRTEMNKVYTKNYRLKKKQEINTIKQQNAFLRQKVEDLSFRLREAEIQINKLKHTDSNQFLGFHSIKEECLKQVESILSKKQTPYQQVWDLERKFKNIVAFSNKPRLDFLNYLMNELLQNLISDQGIYFIQSLQNKTGIWRENSHEPLKKLDAQVFEILNIPFECDNSQNGFKDKISDYIQNEMSKLKVLWKKLYEDYLNIINQGLKLENICRPLLENNNSQNQQSVLNSLKLRLHFEKIKYRKDIRQIRQSWFREIQQRKSQQIKQQTRMQKKCKIQC